MDMWPRFVNLIVTVWLFISAFAWMRAGPLRTDTWIVAVLMFCVVLASVGRPSLRHLNTILAVWLFFSTIFMPWRNPTALWNNIIVSIIVFALSLAPTRGATLPPRHAYR
jgi:hypothetical protein